MIPPPPARSITRSSTANGLRTAQHKVACSARRANAAQWATLARARQTERWVRGRRPGQSPLGAPYAGIGTSGGTSGGAVWPVLPVFSSRGMLLPSGVSQGGRSTPRGRQWQTAAGGSLRFSPAGLAAGPTPAARQLPDAATRRKDLQLTANVPRELQNLYSAVDAPST